MFSKPRALRRRRPANAAVRACMQLSFQHGCRAATVCRWSTLPAQVWAVAHAGGSDRRAQAQGGDAAAGRRLQGGVGPNPKFNWVGPLGTKGMQSPLKRLALRLRCARGPFAWVARQERFGPSPSSHCPAPSPPSRAGRCQVNKARWPHLIFRETPMRHNPDPATNACKPAPQGERARAGTKFCAHLCLPNRGCRCTWQLQAAGFTRARLTCIANRGCAPLQAGA